MIFNMATRVGQYIIYCLLYFVIYKFIGFEMFVVFSLAIIIGELHFLGKQNTKKKEDDDEESLP